VATIRQHQSSQPPSRGRWRPTALREAGGEHEAQLTISILPSGEEGVVIVRVAGEIDLLTIGRLQQSLHAQLSHAPRGLVLDCNEVSFLAASGIALLVDLAERSGAAGVTLRLVTDSRVVLRALEATGMDDVLPRAATVADAVAHCVP
jgi:anti-sigma B factor antagonist